MSKILVVEDSRFFSTLIEKTIRRDLGFEVVLAATFEEAKQAIERETFFLSLLDLQLPDALDGEVVDFVTAKGIPVIVFSGMYSDEMRERILSKNVIDYVVKDSPSSLSYLVSVVRRVHKNQGVKVMVVDDSSTVRKYISNLLASYQLQVLGAADGKAALDLLAENKDVKLIITDFHMPEMDGFELTKKVRDQFSKDHLAIIGLSSADSSTLSARFLKAGANDFINKTFVPEEFFCRVSQNLDTIEHIEALRDAATKDPLTGLFNRRVLFDVGPSLVASRARDQITLTTVIMDADHFKAVNDTYGHDAGDQVLRTLAKVLSEHSRECDMMTRFGGEEFCLLFVNMDANQVEAHLEKIRAAVEAMPSQSGDDTIRITVSMGATIKPHDTLEAMISEADEMLYEAKSSGRNRVILAR
jgi:diguanylate cyclase (GGDEF)-like protein